jgi:transcriptional regulator with PAS, ATPase and Fis domain
MPRRYAKDLLQTLEAITSPVCLFDEQRNVLFANESCSQWIGHSLDEFVGKRASYQVTSELSPEAAVNRLCPPPDAFAGARVRGFVYAADNNSMRRRWAEFLPLAQEDGFLVLAVIDPDDAPEDAASIEDDSQHLRNRVARLRSEHANRFRLDRLIGASPAMQIVRQQVRAAITSRGNALITGPAGSGREHLARTIFYASRQEDEQLFPLDCRLVTEESIASWTRSLSARPRGVGTTSLLLHLESLPEILQSDIVRLCVTRAQEARLIATAEPPTDVGVQSKSAADLRSRIATITIDLPPLTERRQDIPYLAQVLLEEINAQGDKQVRGFAAGAIDELVAYSWPRNVDELVEFVTAAHASAEAVEISPENLPKRLHIAADASRRPRRQPETIVLDDFLAQIERELIVRAINASKGNKARAARLLGLTRPRLYRRMVQLGLESAETASAQTVAEPRQQTDETPEQPEFIEDLPFEEEPDQ